MLLLPFLFTFCELISFSLELIMEKQTRQIFQTCVNTEIKLFLPKGGFPIEIENQISQHIRYIQFSYFLQGFYNFWRRAYNHYQKNPKSQSLPDFQKSVVITTKSLQINTNHYHFNCLMPISKSLLPIKSARRPLMEPQNVTL